MLGRVLGEISTGGGHAVAGDPPALEVSAIVTDRLDGIGLSIRPGEIVGVTGLADAGYHELPYILAGAERARAGRMIVAGNELDLDRITPATAMAAGIVLVPGDRERAGLAMDLTVIENAAVPRTGARSSAVGVIPRAKELADLEPWLDRLELRPRDPGMIVGKLSGGNQQKVVLAKWLAREPKVLALHEPTQAVDVGAREIIITAVKDAAAKGCAVLVASGDENELSMLCDRVIVLADGRIQQELAGPCSPDDIVDAIFAGSERKPLRA
jgi:ABC-type sugar transport system ATPase subunit